MKKRGSKKSDGLGASGNSNPNSYVLNYSTIARIRNSPAAQRYKNREKRNSSEKRMTPRQWERFLLAQHRRETGEAAPEVTAYFREKTVHPHYSHGDNQRKAFRK